MTVDLSLTEKMAYSTVRIETRLVNGQSATGTGFFFELIRDDNGTIPVIVTNKHVIVGGVSGSFSMTFRDTDGNPLAQHERIYLDAFESRWIHHPDPSIDLAIMPIAPLLNEGMKQGKLLFYLPFGPDIVASAEDLDELSPAQDILMVGYPNGIWDEVNNFPIFRRGITATHPGKLYNGRPEFMIDAACFPGSSGSPVLLCNQGIFQDKRGNTRLGGTRFKLLGILYGGPQYTPSGNIAIIQVPTIDVPVAVPLIPNNLGNVIRAEKLLDFVPLVRAIMAQSSQAPTA